VILLVRLRPSFTYCCFHCLKGLRTPKVNQISKKKKKKKIQAHFSLLSFKVKCTSPSMVGIWAWGSSSLIAELSHWPGHLSLENLSGNGPLSPFPGPDSPDSFGSGFNITLVVNLRLARSKSQPPFAEGGWDLFYNISGRKGRGKRQGRVKWGQGERTEAGKEELLEVLPGLVA
jgi:hypothetical protein